jgi:protocatechuate 3,4-dioxygenase beta subunit
MRERRLNRREALAGAGSLSLGALIAACGDGDEPAAERKTTESTTAGSAGGREALLDEAGSCTLTPELTEGPFYFDVERVRSDIREGRDGARLGLALRVRDASKGCEPIQSAVVDIWHCDALGEYSAEPESFLRGAQVTDRDGVAEFTTIYPGWYQGRAVHIHAKVHLDNQTVLTTQLFFDDDLSERVFRAAPYAEHSGAIQRNAEDGIFDERVLLTVKRDGDGWLGALTFDVERA